MVNLNKRKPPKYIDLNGVAYTADSKCPACSGERDTGGRLEYRKRKNFYLRCRKCAYTIHSFQAKLKQEEFLKNKHDRELGIRQSFKRKTKKLKITKADAKRAKLFLKLKQQEEQKARQQLSQHIQQAKRLIHTG